MEIILQHSAPHYRISDWVVRNVVQCTTAIIRVSCRAPLKPWVTYSAIMVEGFQKAGSKSLCHGNIGAQEIANPKQYKFIYNFIIFN